MAAPEFGAEEQENADTLIGLALREDWGDDGDITSKATISRSASVNVVARRPGVLAGLPILVRLCWRMEPASMSNFFVKTEIGCGRANCVARITGLERTLLAVKRIALNFLQRLSGVATLTALYVERVKDTGVFIFDTRKTTPGWRRLEKYAVLCGGSQTIVLGCSTQS